jgi:hypothetical protein
VVRTRKNYRERWQLVSLTLMRHLATPAKGTRGARPIRMDSSCVPQRLPDGRAPLPLHLVTGRPVRSVVTRGVTARWLRHTTVTWVERSFSEAVERAYMGHAEISVSEDRYHLDLHESARLARSLQRSRR